MKSNFFNLHYLIAVAMSAVITLALPGCGNDDNDDAPEVPKIVKRMKSIDENDFVYTNGKITHILEEGDNIADIDYATSIIRIDGHVNYAGTYYVEDGLVYKYVDDDNSGYQEFVYEDGHIVSWKKYYDSGEEYISFEWKDGVIVRQTEYDNDYYYDVVELHCDYQFDYTNEPDYGGAIACFQSDSMFYDDLPAALIVQGFFGVWPKYLVSGAKDLSGNFSGQHSFSYVLDKDGYPLNMNGYESAKFTWETLN